MDGCKARREGLFIGFTTETERDGAIYLLVHVSYTQPNVLELHEE